MVAIKSIKYWGKESCPNRPAIAGRVAQVFWLSNLFGDGGTSMGCCFATWSAAIQNQWTQRVSLYVWHVWHLTPWFLFFIMEVSCKNTPIKFCETMSSWENMGDPGIVLGQHLSGMVWKNWGCKFLQYPSGFIHQLVSGKTSMPKIHVCFWFMVVNWSINQHSCWIFG